MRAEKMRLKDARPAPGRPGSLTCFPCGEWKVILVSARSSLSLGTMIPGSMAVGFLKSVTTALRQSRFRDVALDWQRRADRYQI